MPDFTPAAIPASTLRPSMVFCFGSNTAGRHGKGAAEVASRMYGARRGVGEGLAGESYAIPTKMEGTQIYRGRPVLVPLSLEAIGCCVERFLKFACDHPEFEFVVTRFGCGLSGFADHQIAPLIAAVPKNCILPPQWPGLIAGRAGRRSLEGVRFACFVAPGAQPDVVHYLGRVVQRLTQRGAVLRAGRSTLAIFEAVGAPGATGLGAAAEIWAAATVPGACQPAQIHSWVAKGVVPDWPRLDVQQQAVAACDVGVVMGPTLREPVDFVLCWTPGGEQSAQELARTHCVAAGEAGIALADMLGLPVINLRRPGSKGALSDLAGAYELSSR